MKNQSFSSALAAVSSLHLSWNKTNRRKSATLRSGMNATVRLFTILALLIMTWGKALLVDASSPSNAVISSPAPSPICLPSCGSFGFCVPDRNVCADPKNCDTYTCECKSGFTGKDCSLRAPDICHVDASPGKAELHVEKCFNGGLCEERKTEGGHVWAICNCKNAFGASGLSMENLDCRYTITDVCEADKAHSDHAFCYNGGRCIKINDLGSKEPHPGCNCSGTGFAGRHCQFPQENIPIDEEVFLATGKDIIADYDLESEQSEAGKTTYKKDTYSMRTTMVALIFLGLVLSVVYGIAQRHNARRRRRHRAVMVEGQGFELEESCSTDGGEVGGFNNSAELVVGERQIC